MKVAPKASRDGVVGWLGDVFKIRVTAAPERGKANSAVVKLLAKTLGVPRERLQIVAGDTKTLKLVAISGMSEKELRERLERACAPTI